MSDSELSRKAGSAGRTRVGLGQPLELRGRRIVGEDRRVEQVAQLVEVVGDREDVELLLGGEVPVDEPAAIPTSRAICSIGASSIPRSSNSRRVATIRSRSRSRTRARGPLYGAVRQTENRRLTHVLIDC
jgi:hypothetical protein